MKAIPWRVQVGAVMVGYAMVFAIAGLLIAERYWMYTRHPEDAAAAGGMYAAGDSMLAIFIACMLFVVTVGLAFVIRNSEVAYTRYAKTLFGLSLTAPVSVAAMSIRGASQGVFIWEWVGMFRMEVSPVVIIGLIVSWAAARFKPAKRWALSAVLIEAATLVVVIAAVVMTARSGSQ